MSGLIGLAVGLFIGAGAGVVITAVLVAARDVCEYEKHEAGMPEEEKNGGTTES
ncbi:MAG: hypothetical protein K5637_01865 [Lachnospiraceae bacterium]|nr:hypothetical protein [Lachnospiraceae bacterium]